MISGPSPTAIPEPTSGEEEQAGKGRADNGRRAREGLFGRLMVEFGS
jgi:hypothetical protein